VSQVFLITNKGENGVGGLCGGGGVGGVGGVLVGGGRGFTL